MKKFFKIAGIIAVAQVLCFWMVYGLLMAAWPHTTLWQFLGWMPAPPAPPYLIFLVYTFGILDLPAGLLPDGMNSEYHMIFMGLCSVLNGVIWGLGLSLVIHAGGRMFRRFSRRREVFPADYAD